MAYKRTCDAEPLYCEAPLYLGTFWHNRACLQFCVCFLQAEGNIHDTFVWVPYQINYSWLDLLHGWIETNSTFCCGSVPLNIIYGIHTTGIYTWDK
jgi:hypothetical protein